MFIGVGPSGVREELLGPRTGCEAVEVMEAIATGSTLGPGPKDVLVPSTGLPRSWFSVSGWGWFTWKGLTGAEAVAAPGERAGGTVARVRITSIPKSKGWKTIATRSMYAQAASPLRDWVHPGLCCAEEPVAAPAITWQARLLTK